MKEMTYEEKKQFMFDEKNIRKCDDCPYNIGAKNYSPDYRLPCGQQNCWVSVACHPYDYKI